MTSLAPKEAAGLANKVYEIRREADWKDLLGDLEKIKNPASLFGFDKTPNRAVGQSGWGQSSGFAYMANGSGPRNGESLVAIRGTASLADALTDARVSFAHSPSGYVVHRGFALTFDSIKKEMDGFFRQRNTNPSHIHVVGHSLGGAIACLTAEYLSLMGQNVSLYTFGCPRVGDSRYAAYLDKLIGLGNIHRAYHEADPVSMVPLYPFVPVSNSNIGHQLPWNGSRIAFDAHRMENYIASVADCSWQSLPKAQSRDFFASAEAWLEQVGEGGGSIVMLSSSVLRQILKALRWILSSLIDISAMTLQFAASGAVIVVDVLAYLLYHGYLMGAKIARYIKYLMVAILRFLGRTADAGMEITGNFIRFVIDMFFRTLSSAASRALSLFP